MSCADRIGGQQHAVNTTRSTSWSTSTEALWQQRIAMRRPLQYLINAAFWRDLVLAVGPGVLIPRPETEEVELVHSIR